MFGVKGSFSTDALERVLCLVRKERGIWGSSSSGPFCVYRGTEHSTVKSAKVRGMGRGKCTVTHAMGEDGILRKAESGM